MEDGPACEYFTESLEGRRPSADASEPAADDKVEAIAPTSRSYARSTSWGVKEEVRMDKPQEDMHYCHVGFEHHLVVHPEQGVLIGWECAA